MIPISTIANSVAPSLIRSLFNKAKTMEDVIDFTLGDPDVQPHQAIKDAACDSIQKGKTRYSQNAGLLDLRKTISDYYVRSEGFYYNPLTEILVSVGAMEGLYLTFLSILNEGDEVIIPAPFYVNYVQMVQMCHAVPVIVDKPADEPLSFNIEDIEKAISERTKVIIINTPSNPSGKLIPERKLQGIATLAKKYNLTVISDEVYKKLIYGDTPFKSIVAIEGMRERTVLINSLSKEFCMTGYRLGYVLAPEELIATMTKLQENVVACAPLPSQYAGIEALSGKQDYSKNMVNVFTERRNLLYEGLKDLPLIKCRLPQATFYMMVDVSETGMDSVEFAYALLEKEHVAVVPGVAYGECCKHHIRIAFTIDNERIKEGTRRIAHFVQSII